VIVGASVVFRDITQLREAEQRLDRIVLDLKTPLTRIVEAAQSILDNRAAESAREPASVVIDSARSMQGMIAGLSARRF
jgi:hypothetical protein